MMRKIVLPLVIASLAVGAATVLAGWDEGIAAFNSKDFDQAITEFEELLEQEPESWRGHYMLGLSLAQKGRRLEALEHLRRAQELRLGDPEGRVQIQFLPDIPLQRGFRPCPTQTSPEAPVDLCDVGFEISRMTPCTSAEDCPAHELWSSALGPPGLRSARPERGPETPADDR